MKSKDRHPFRFFTIIPHAGTYFLLFKGRYRQEGGTRMGRGEMFGHKRKGHPGRFPKDQMAGEKQHKDSNYDDEQTFPHEAFKNRMHNP